MSKSKVLLKVIGTLIGILIVSLIASIAVGAVLALTGIEAELSMMMLLGVLASQIIYGIFAYWLIKKRKAELGPSYLKKQGFKSDSWKMILIGLGTAGFGNVLIGLIMEVLGDHALVNNSIDMVTQALSATTPFEMVIQFVLVVIMAPIIEEYLFRGFVFTETKRAFSLAASVVLNGLIFGLYHMNLLQGINTFFFGMVLSLVYYYRKNITDAIIVHMVNNLVAVSSMYIPQYAEILGIILIVSIFVGGYFFYKVIKDGKNEVINE